MSIEEEYSNWVVLRHRAQFVPRWNDITVGLYRQTGITGILVLWPRVGLITKSCTTRFGLITKNGWAVRTGITVMNITYSKIFGFLGSRFSHYKTSLKHTPEVHAVRAVSKHLCLWEKQASTSVLTWYRLHSNHNFSTSIYILLIPYWRKIFHRHHANYNMIVWDLYSLKTSICTTHQTPLKQLSHRSH